MSLVRAFTTRRSNKRETDITSPFPQRSNTTKHAFATGTIRNKISGPVELLSTTNMLSYNAPDLFPNSTASASPSSPPSLTHSSSSSARSSSEQSIATPLTSSENDGGSPSPNHLSCYFEKHTSSEDISAPQIPQRSPSHTKRNHEILHRKRSISRMSQRSISGTHSVKNSVTSFARDSMQMFSTTPELIEDDSSFTTSSSTPSIGLPSTPSPAPLHSKKISHSQHHPFGAELAQVTELAEEYSNVSHDPAVHDGLDAMTDKVKIVLDPEEQDLLERGFFRFEAADYMKEIEPFYTNAFDVGMRTQIWI